MTTTITVPTAGDPVHASWGENVADAINAIQDRACYVPYSYPAGISPADVSSTVSNMTAAGGAVLIPLTLDGTMRLQSVTIRNGDTASARAAEFAIYTDDGTGTLTRVTGTDGTYSFTPSAASDRTANVSSPGVELRAGIYWLCIRNSHASNTFGLRRVANSTEATGTAARYDSTGIGALGATLDPSTFSTQLTGVPLVRLNGRVFGEATAF